MFATNFVSNGSRRHRVRGAGGGDGESGVVEAKAWVKTTVKNILLKRFHAPESSAAVPTTDAQQPREDDQHAHDRSGDRERSVQLEIECCQVSHYETDFWAKFGANNLPNQHTLICVPSSYYEEYFADLGL